MILGSLLGVVIALTIVTVTLYGLLLTERARVSDLLSRLAARTHGEYAAFAQLTAYPSVEEPPSRWDPTGMIEVEDPDA